VQWVGVGVGDVHREQQAGGSQHSVTAPHALLLPLLVLLQLLLQ
jgi:hypothetical protein